MWWAVALVAIMLLPLIALKSLASYQLLCRRSEAPEGAGSILLAWSMVFLASVGMNLVILGGTVFVAVHPALDKSDVWWIVSPLFLCVGGMLIAGLRHHQLRSRLDADAKAFVEAVHVPDLPWKRVTDKPSETG